MSGCESVLRYSQYPMLLRGYDEIQCPFCNTICYPDAKASDGTIIYNKHILRAALEPIGQERRLEVDKDKKLII